MTLAPLVKFVHALSKNGVNLIGEGKSFNFTGIEFDAEEFDWQAFANSVKEVFNDFDKEVSIDGEFTYDGKNYSFETDTEDGVVYFDNL